MKPPKTNPGKPWTEWTVYLALALLTLVLYGRVTQNSFIVYDDPEYVTGNPITQGGLTWDGFVWAFGSTHLSNWHPLTWLSHMLDCQLFGLNAGMHHLVNLLLHVANTLLLFHVLRRMTGVVWRSGFVAAMFAWHPLHVESVAWVAERKDVLSALFWMLTLLAYLRYVERPGVGRYLITLLCFALGLMAKPMVVTLPFVLLLLDYWPLKRLQWPPAVSGGIGATLSSSGVAATVKAFRNLWIEKIPLFLLTAASCFVTYWAQHKGHSVASIEFLPVSARIANSLVAYMDYVLKMIWPTHLAVFYPLRSSQPIWKLAAAAGLLGITSVFALRWVRQRPYLLVGWLLYLGTLVPVIGLVQVGDQAMADRYSYIPLVGLGIMIAWGANSLLVNRSSAHLPIQVICLAVLAAWVTVTGVQISYWKDSRTLFEHAREVTEGNNVAFNVLGNQMLEEKPPRIEEAKRLFMRSLAIRPNDPGARHCLGDAYKAEGNYAEAIAQYREALRRDPTLHETHNALGVCLVRQNQTDEAIQHFKQAVGLVPTYADSYQNLALTLHTLGRLDEAVGAYEQLLKLKPGSKAVLLGLGNALIGQRKFVEAMTRFRQALELDPNSVDALNRMAWIYATHEEAKVRNGAEAVRLATQACALTGYQQPQSLNALAAAYAETGRFEDAVQTAQKALALAQAAGNSGLAAIIQNLLQLYQARTPYRDTAK